MNCGCRPGGLRRRWEAGNRLHETFLGLGKATIQATHEPELSHAALARVIGLSEPTISRIAKEGRGIDPESKAGQLALLVIRLFRSLDPLVGADQQKRHD